MQPGTFSTPRSPSDIPKNLPVFNLGPGETGPGTGWTSVGTNVLVRTTDQVYRLHPRVGWQLSAYFTSEHFANPGLSHFRRPASLRAWLTVLVALPRKYWRKLKGEI